MQNKYTSLKLSKWLQERGFEGHVEMVWSEKLEVHEDNRWELELNEDAGGDLDRILAYDLLNDLCVKYAKELFGEAIRCALCGLSVHGREADDYDETVCTACDVTIAVLRLLQQNKKEEAEAYIMEHSILKK